MHLWYKYNAVDSILPTHRWSKAFFNALLMPPKDVDLDVVCKLASMFVMEHLSVVPKLDDSSAGSGAPFDRIFEFPNWKQCGAAQGC